MSPFSGSSRLGSGPLSTPTPLAPNLPPSQTQPFGPQQQLPVVLLGGEHYYTPRLTSSAHFTFALSQLREMSDTKAPTTPLPSTHPSPPGATAGELLLQQRLYGDITARRTQLNPLWPQSKPKPLPTATSPAAPTAAAAPAAAAAAPAAAAADASTTAPAPPLPVPVPASPAPAHRLAAASHSDTAAKASVAAVSASMAAAAAAAKARVALRAAAEAVAEAEAAVATAARARARARAKT